jgi:hypothetical protein
VRLAGYTWSNILEDDFRGDVETGWWLLGPLDYEDEIVACRADRARADGHTGERYGMWFHGKHATTIEKTLADGPGWRVVGCLHTHPGAHTPEEIEPSNADLEMWATWARDYDRPFAGLIAGPGHNEIPFAYPDVKCWITDPAGVYRSSALSIERNHY